MTPDEKIAELEKTADGYWKRVVELEEENKRLSAQSPSWSDQAKGLLTYLLSNKTAIAAVLIAAWTAYKEVSPTIPPETLARVARIEAAIGNMEAAEKQPEPVKKGGVR